MCDNTLNNKNQKYAEAKRIIRNARDSHQLVLFVGAGASVKAGMPLWRKAVEQIADKIDFGSKIENSDYMIIPQYYYNSHGRKEYTQLMREIFRYYDKLIPSEVHDAIIRFDVDTIITTNYDHLIEQAAENNGEYRYVVSRDSDLPYRNTSKELIKIHGDFEHDNFVLKEDDYIHYHHNFKLIENYVKSLIGTKTVLFIGYSFGDPDVRHIFSWVKEILDEHFQRAYLINVDTKANQDEIEYYRHLGVNIIYSQELFSEDEVDYTDKSELLLKTLYYFIDDEESNALNELYQYLKPFNSLKYTYRKYIEEAFYKQHQNKKSTLRLGDDNYVKCDARKPFPEDKELLSLIEKSTTDKSVDFRIQSITDVLNKGIVKGTKIPELVNDFVEDKTFDFEKNIDIPEWIEAITYFDYRHINDIKDHNSKVMSEVRPELYLQQAYICAFLDDYLSAYYCLDNATRYFYRKGEYTWYFISLWNKRNVCDLLLGNNISLDEATLDYITSDFKSIDLDKTLQSLPDLGNDNNQFLKDLIEFKFSSDLLYDVVSKTKDVNTQANKKYIVFGGVPAYEKMRQQVNDYYNYVMYNCFIVDGYRENNMIFTMFVFSLLASVTTPDKEADDDPIYGNYGNVHADALNEIDIHLILRYISSGYLKELFDEFNVQVLNIDDNGKEYLKKLSSIMPGVFDPKLNIDIDIFWRYLCFISHIQIDEDIAVSTLSVLAGLKDTDYFQIKKESLTEYSHALYMQELYKSSDVCREAMTLIYRLLDLMSAYDEDWLRFNYKTPISTLVALCAKGNCYISDLNKITSILKPAYNDLLCNIYSGCTDDIQKVVKVYFNNWFCSDTNHNFVLYSKLVLEKIIEPDPTIEDRALVFLENSIKEKRREKENGLYTFSGENLETYLVNLYLAESFIHVDNLRDIVLESDDRCSKWLFDMNGFDYSEFNLSWLDLCSPGLLQSIAENDVARTKVLAIYKEKYTTETFEKSIHEKVVKYLI